MKEAKRAAYPFIRKKRPKERRDTLHHGEEEQVPFQNV